MSIAFVLGGSYRKKATKLQKHITKKLEKAIKTMKSL